MCGRLAFDNLNSAANPGGTALILVYPLPFLLSALGGSTRQLPTSTALRIRQGKQNILPCQDLVKMKVE